MSENKKDSKMKFVKIGILILVGLDIVFACSTVNVKNFTYYKKSVNSNISIRTEGYYYNRHCDTLNNTSDTYFFYPDGFFMRGNIFPNSPLSLLDAKLDTLFNKGNEIRNTVYHRGAFETMNDSIKIEVFECYVNCQVVKVFGKIINDSTLLFIGKSEGKHGYMYHQSSDYCDTFHFRKLNWKPDSTYQIGFEKELKKHKYKF
jgi:hypothetical protein